jgi:polyvinyl alcohol dehydrogenase (cytochrome)
MSERPGTFGGVVSRARLAALVTAVTLAVPALAQADWPVYGHDLSNTRNAGSDGPSLAQVRSLHQTWVFKSSTGDFTGTPVVANGVLVAGNYGGTVYALDAVTGKLRWSHKVQGPVDGSAAIDPGALGGGLVFVPVAVGGAPRLVALSLTDGSSRWDVMLTKQNGADVFGSPTYSNGTVYMGTSSNNTDSATSRGSLVALDELTGKVLWQTFTVPTGHDGGGVWSTPAIDTGTGRIYLGTGNAYHPPVAATTDSIMVLDQASGAMLGHFQGITGDVFSGSGNPLGPDADFGASPNLLTGPGGRLLVGEGAKNGVYYAVDRETMSPIWRLRIGPGSVVGGILASTASDGTGIYGTDTLDGQVFKLGTGGALRWLSLDPSTLDYSPTSLSNGVLYSVNPLGLLVARNARTGTPLAAVPLGGPSFGGVSIAGGAVYAAVGVGPLPQPLPPLDGPGSIVAFR